MTHDLFEGPRRHENPLMQLGYLKDLKTLLEASQRRLRYLQEASADPDEILKERAFSQSVERELRRLETHILLSELEQ